MTGRVKMIWWFPFPFATPSSTPTRVTTRQPDDDTAWMIRFDDTYSYHNVYFSSSSFFFFLASILSLSVESIVGKFLRLFLLITINVTIVEPSLRITHRSLYIFLFFFLFSETRSSVARKISLLTKTRWNNIQ